LSENGIGDGGLVAAPAGRAVDLVRASQWIKRRNAPSLRRRRGGRSSNIIISVRRERPSSIVAPNQIH
jgi:hypothetical protein